MDLSGPRGPREAAPWCIFSGWVFYRNRILQELKSGCPDVEQSLFWKIWPVYVRFFCPALILLTFAQEF